MAGSITIPVGPRNNAGTQFTNKFKGVLFSDVQLKAEMGERRNEGEIKYPYQF